MWTENPKNPRKIIPVHRDCSAGFTYTPREIWTKKKDRKALER